MTELELLESINANLEYLVQLFTICFVFKIFGFLLRVVSNIFKGV